MGVEFRTLLIPRDNTLRPDANAVRRLLAAWREAGFLPHASGRINFPGADDDAHFDEQAAFDRPEFILQWFIEDRRQARLRHPLMEMVEAPEYGASYEIKLHFADDFVETADEIIDPPPGICSCGADLAFDADDDIFYAARIRRVCSSCGEAYRPQDHVGYYQDGITGEQSELPGGATYRFAIVIDCAAHWQTSANVAPEATSAFLRLSSTALDTELYEVGDFY